jgi:hypothetical protein
MADYSLLDVFPTLQDTDKPTYNFAKIALVRVGLAASQSPRQLRLSLSAKLANELRLRYYRYEVTFGLYVMTAGEKLVLNGIVLSIFFAVLYGLYVGLRPFLIHLICRLVYYLTGTADASNTLCTD